MFDQLIRSEDGVSPVIGVILMVAITVILAAVIAGFVLGLTPNQNQAEAPTVSISEDYDGSAEELTFAIEGGEALDTGTLTVKAQSDVFPGPSDSVAVSSVTSNPELTAGDSWTVSARSGESLSDATIKVVWEGSTQSATLSTWEGPDA